MCRALLRSFMLFLKRQNVPVAPRVWADAHYVISERPDLLLPGEYLDQLEELLKATSTPLLVLLGKSDLGFTLNPEP